MHSYFWDLIRIHVFLTILFPFQIASLNLTSEFHYEKDVHLFDFKLAYTYPTIL